MVQKLEYTVLGMLEDSIRMMKAQPLNLGGVAGAGGGVGGPAAGFVGYLPQGRVAYDQDEFASNITPASGMSILTNLNHIRYRLNILESGGSISVFDENTSSQYYDIDTIHFSGAGVTVLDLGGGDIRIGITSSGSGGISDAPSDGKAYGRLNAAWSDLDSRFLKLDATNDPVTRGLKVSTNQVGDVYALEIEHTNGGGSRGGMSVTSKGFAAKFIDINGLGIEIDHTGIESATVNDGVMDLYRYGDGSAVHFTTPAIYLFDSDADAVYSAGLLEHYDQNWNKVVGLNAYADVDDIVVLFDSVNAISTDGRLISLCNQTEEKFGVNGSGYISINGVKVVSDRVIDSRISGSINSGDATTDAVIDAIRDALIAHGLISAT